MPGGHTGVICKHEDWIQAFCQGYRDLEQKQGNDVTRVEPPRWQCDELQFKDSGVDVCRENIFAFLNKLQSNQDK